ncbi:MAG: hypothetical protein PWQ97_1009 [Tepidanaerobacteraceae bacterium]|nr:hypothetical protein [Tepidanaerobacteraceae bacterium]
MGFSNVKNVKRLMSLLVTVFICINIFTYASLKGIEPKAFAADSTYTSEQLADKAIQFINDKFKSGEKIDGYTAYVLMRAGEDLSSEKWTRDGVSLKEEIEKFADLLGNNRSLISYIVATQNEDGSFGPYANEYGTKAPLQALAMAKSRISKADTLYEKAEQSISKAVEYFKSIYMNKGYDSAGWAFDYRCVEALALAGENLSSDEWEKNGSTLKDEVLSSAENAASCADEEDAVSLAKNLTAVHAVDPESDLITTLADAIKSKVNTVENAVYFGNNLYDDVMVLTALGKTGNLDGIDQEKALNYINSSDFKHDHKDSWGYSAGCAWGVYYSEEPDLTAQVLTALSYFDGASDKDSKVYKTIQDGLAYLNDIQDSDTAAIYTQFDSTFATAETVIALESNGCNDYLESNSTWVKNSKTKTVAQTLMALNQWQDTERMEKLANILKARHSANGFENSVYSDMWAYIALGEAGKIGEISTNDAKNYILSKQSKAQGTAGAWGETWEVTFYPDFMSTAQAIRALSYLPGASGDTEIQAAIESGLAYMKKQLQPDGSVYTTTPYPDDPVVDTAETIVTLAMLGMDPKSWKSSEGNTPVDYMLKKALNSDGSFGSTKNTMDAAEALSAFLLIEGESDSGSGGSTAPVTVQKKIKVYVAVVGKNNELLFAPDSVTLSSDDKWGLTALGALDATGLDYVDDDGFVKSIEGQANSGMNGWMYKVNSSIPNVKASEKTLSEGDKVIWWYSTDYNSSGPSWGSLSSLSTATADTTAVSSDLKEQNKKLPEMLRASEDALAALGNIDEKLGLKQDDKKPLEDLKGAAVIVHGVRSYSNINDLKTQKSKLDENKADIEDSVSAENGAVLVDSGQEVGLVIPAGALSKDTQIRIKEIDVSQPAKEAEESLKKMPQGFGLVSGIYDFSPDNITFEIPVTITLKVILPPMVKPENAILACYDEKTGHWVAVPAVMDLEKNLVFARVKHFSKYAVMIKDEKKSFADIGESFAWAKDYVETLAGAGILSGVGGDRFEPGRPVTRAEFVSMLQKAMGLAAPEDAKTSFVDVKKSAWYYEAVSAASASGLVSGYKDGTFRPDETITREEISVILSRALKLSGSEQSSGFKDEGSISSWSRPAIFAAVEKGLLKGYQDGTFRPKNAVSRAECAVIIYRMLDIK